VRYKVSLLSPIAPDV